MTRAKLIENLLPLIVFRFLLRVYLRARGLGWHTFYGRYPTLADVPSTPGGQNSDWYVRNAIAQVESIQFETSRQPMGDPAGQLLLPLLVSQLLDRAGTVTVLDFGGGAAKGLKCIFDHAPGIDPARLRYILVETPAMCRAIREPLARMQKEKFGGATFVDLAEEIPPSLPQPLIVHARSSLQYVSDYRAALYRLLALAPEILIVPHTPLTDEPTCAQEQRNHPHRTLARWVFNRGEFISEIENSGYRQGFIFDHGLPATGKDSASANDVSMIFYRTTPTSQITNSDNAIPS